MESDQNRRDGALERLAVAVAKAERVGNVAFQPAFAIGGMDGGVPPLARMIQGGQGGEVRLKLYLCITMMATREPFDLQVTRTSMGWARLLGLPPDTGSRRVSTGLKWLASAGLIELTPRSGSTPAIKLKDPVDPSLPYARPFIQGPRYIGLPIDLWKNGWIVDLTATGLALLIVLLENQGGYKKPRYVTTARRARYGLSHGTWTRATKELECYELLQVTRVPQGGDFDHRRMRNAYWVDLERLTTQSTQEQRRDAAILLRRT